MELKTKIEKEHYNRQQEDVIRKNFAGFDWEYGSERMGCVIGMPFRYAENKIEEIIKSRLEHNKEIRLLDFGCGVGLHSIKPAKLGAIVDGIDISDVMIEIAKEWARREGVENKAKFAVMDCEKLEFPDNTFDMVFNCGTLSCIDRKKGYDEIIRVLKPDGYFISIDTLGYNPVLNANRRIKSLFGLRTKQTLNNILKNEDIKNAKQYFDETEVRYFNLITVLIAPFQKHLKSSGFFRLLSKIDEKVLHMKFFQKYAFKVAFVFHNPKKHN